MASIEERQKENHDTIQRQNLLIQQLQETRPNTPKKSGSVNEEEVVVLDSDEEMIDTSSVPKHNRESVWQMQKIQRGPSGEY